MHYRSKIASYGLDSVSIMESMSKSEKQCSYYQGSDESI